MALRLLAKGSSTLNGTYRNFGTGTVRNAWKSVNSKPLGKRSFVVPGAVSAATVGGIFLYRNELKSLIREDISGRKLISNVVVAHAAAAPQPQPNVASQTKNHALYLWIHLKPNADKKKCAKALANIQKTVDSVNPPDLRDEDDEIIAGVGFGPKFYSSLGKQAPKDYPYPDRKGNLGDMPSTGGDVFIHAKSNSLGNLFDLCQQIKRQLPPDSIAKFSDTYSFVYRNGRDLSGFIDGTENAADDESRLKIAADSASGGSFCITQKWIHQHDHIEKQKVSTLEGWVGRQFSDSTELKKKSASSHVARMTSGPDFAAKKPVEIVRQSMPYGTVAGDSGLFFIGFAAAPDNFEYMLDRMVGNTKDGVCDDIMRLTKCVEGNYWYFPSANELKSLF